MSERFRITDDHIALMKNLVITWNDRAYDGAPAVDLKRPYGNSDVLYDIANHLQWEQFEDLHGEYHLTAQQAEAAKLIHSQMDTVLQIAVMHPGEDIRGTWVRKLVWSKRDWKRDR